MARQPSCRAGDSRGLRASARQPPLGEPPCPRAGRVAGQRRPSARLPSLLAPARCAEAPGSGRTGHEVPGCQRSLYPGGRHSGRRPERKASNAVLSVSRLTPTFTLCPSPFRTGSACNRGTSASPWALSCPTAGSGCAGATRSPQAVSGSALSGQTCV